MNGNGKLLAVWDRKVFAVWNMKGGVGKTTATINLAYNWAQAGKRVLVVDLDPQVNTTPIFTRANEFGCTVKDILDDPAHIRKAVYRTKYKDIDIIRGSEKLGEGYRQDALKEALIMDGGTYDAVVIDCQPSCGSLTRTALYAADYVVTPVALDRFCLDNLRMDADILSGMAEEKGEPLDDRWMIFANKVRDIRSQKEIYADIMGKSDYPFLGTCIRERAAVPNSLAKRKPLSRHAANNPVTQDFQSLADEIWTLTGEVD